MEEILSKANQLLKEINIILEDKRYKPEDLLILSSRAFNKFREQKERLILFDAFWYLGCKIREKEFRISEELKLKFFNLRTNLLSEVAITDINPYLVVEIEMQLTRLNMPLSGSHRKQLWIIIYEIIGRKEIEQVSANFHMVNSRLKLTTLISQFSLYNLSILEIGSSPSGGVFLELKNAIKNKHITGYAMDISFNWPDLPKLKKILKAEGTHLISASIDTFNYNNEDISTLPFRDKSFNLIYAHDVMWFLIVTKLKISLKEILRILKPDGIFVFNTPSYLNNDIAMVEAFFSNLISNLHAKCKQIKEYEVRETKYYTYIIERTH